MKKNTTSRKGDRECEQKTQGGRGDIKCEQKTQQGGRGTENVKRKHDKEERGQRM